MRGKKVSFWGEVSKKVFLQLDGGGDICRLAAQLLSRFISYWLTLELSGPPANCIFPSPWLSPQPHATSKSFPTPASGCWLFLLMNTER